MRGAFITGTDTGVGKTLVAAAMLRALARAGLKTVGMKPVASGSAATPGGLRNDDALQLQAAANSVRPYELVNPYVFAPPIAPHLAA
ncbi:MAG: ATP-dependent dethiobiotin synthetase BioD, partial [Gammaproteobacteria bacterium]